MLKDSVYACNNEKNRVIVAKLAPYVDLLGAIRVLTEKYNFKAAMISVCFGSLTTAEIETIAEDKTSSLGAVRSDPMKIDGPLQLLSAQGTVAFDEENEVVTPHLHGIFIDKNGKIHGGHMLEGKCPVLRTMEITIEEIVGLNVTRRFNTVSNSIQLMID